MLRYNQKDLPARGRGEARLLSHQNEGRSKNHGLGSQPLARANANKKKNWTRSQPSMGPIFPSVALPPRPRAHLRHLQKTNCLNPEKLSCGLSTWRPLGSLVDLESGPWHTLGGVWGPGSSRVSPRYGVDRKVAGRPSVSTDGAPDAPRPSSLISSGVLRLPRVVRPSPPPNSRE